MVPLQFITHTTANISYEESAMIALRGGCRWIQLRMKSASDDEVRPIAERLLAECRKFDATFILDDRVELAQNINADGVHLGQNDMPVREARAKLGDGFIIGATANTPEQAISAIHQGADYLGCGPYRYTTTKTNLAPVLGLEGYRAIIAKLDKLLLRTPIVAIGGIEVEDVSDLLDTGVSGIAISGAILRATDPEAEVQRFLTADL